MLNVTKKETIMLTGNTTIDGTIVETYSITVDKADPLKAHVSTITSKPDLVKANLAECRSNREEFRKQADAIQDELLTE